MSNIEEENKKLKAEIAKLIGLVAEPNTFGEEYEKYYTMHIDEFREEYNKIRNKENTLRFISGERERIEKRKRGIDCHCSYGMICKACDTDL